VTVTTLKYHPAREQAREIGALRYDPGVPCPRCQTSLRYVSNTVCVQCASMAIRKGKSTYSVTKPENLAEAARRRAEYRAELSNQLPRRAAKALTGYSESPLARRHSRYLNGLVRAVHVKPEPKVERIPQPRARRGSDWRQTRLTERWSK
jgi:hypothetical protein